MMKALRKRFIANTPNLQLAKFVFSHKKASEINLAKLSDYNNNPWTKINTKNP